MSNSVKFFKVECHGRRRGLLPGGVLVCSVCDYDHSCATVIPNEHHIKDVPNNTNVWTPGFEPC